MVLKRLVVCIFSLLLLIGILSERASATKRMPYEKQLLSIAFKKKKSKQVIIVHADRHNSYKAILAAYEYKNGNWKRLYTYPAVIGKNGISSKKREGDGKSPVGMYFIGQGFGTLNKPSGLKMSYKKTSSYDYWIDDVKSKDYNKWKVYKGNPHSKWKSFERLKQPLYKYAAVIRYNEDQVAGKGSAIFLHVWRNASSPTAGCTALQEGNVLRLMKWVDSDKRPLIIQGTEADLKRLTK